MSFNPTTHYGQSTIFGWSNYVSFDLAIENDDNSSCYIKRFYIRNIISNPQEVGNYENFCIYFNTSYMQSGIYNHYANLDQYVNHPDVSGLFGETGSITLQRVFTRCNYSIPYPLHYTFQPGNVSYDYDNSAGGWMINNKHGYKFPFEFFLSPGEMFHFELKFQPKPRKIDYYRADLVLEYQMGGDSGFVYQKIHKIQADHIPVVNEIDGKQINTQVLKINGISAGNILLAQ